MRNEGHRQETKNSEQIAFLQKYSDQLLLNMVLIRDGVRHALQ
ncbi:hypothetical protein FP2506_16869 [Fulvimarina pelagi HTCC2506]|uniref:Uncharacterized protein n=1 Tax=Fulvimarina pelagi HTCC2506 TaxID=314231 RepID=Q0G2Q6_9HYPH|nr:hypothetical protein FP2506_16869 [Fulvimarina pelagi HTCC2506]